MIEHEYRVVSCDSCIWQDYYQTGARTSYPPRCPECGEATMEHEFITARYPASIRAVLGRDNGIRTVFGDPNRDYAEYAERRFGSAWMRQAQGK